MSYLSDLERQATDKARRIRDLKGVTPEFSAARDRASEALLKHEAMIEAEEHDLLDLRAAAAEYALTLGEAFIPPAGSGPEGGDMADAFAAEFEETDEAEKDLSDLIFEDETDEPDEAEDYSCTLQEETADAPTEQEITEAVVAIASPPPPVPDESDAPEMSNDQAERAEELLAERELETAGGFLSRSPFVRNT